VKELENSVWEITRNDTVMHLTLLDGGYFEYINIEGENVTLETTYGGIDKGMTWNLKGKSITLDFNNGFLVQSGEINSNFDSMQGTFENKQGSKGEWSGKFKKVLQSEIVDEREKELESLQKVKISDEVEIEVKGTGNELCQDILEKKKYLDYKNNYNDWNSFCTDSLDLDGYWEFNEVSHLTGVTLDEAKITININGKTIFDGDYYSLLEKHFDDDEPGNNKNTSKLYGRHISSEEDKYLITSRTLESFNVNHTISRDKFEIQKLGFLIASTDELGYGKDYGDFLMGIHYDGEDIDFEYSGGVGVVELLDAE